MKLNPQIRTTQPKGVGQINWANPITRGLTYAVLPHQPFNLIDGTSLEVVSQSSQIAVDQPVLITQTVAHVHPYANSTINTGVEVDSAVTVLQCATETGSNSRGKGYAYYSPTPTSADHPVARIADSPSISAVSMMFGENTFYNYGTFSALERNNEYGLSWQLAVTGPQSGSRYFIITGRGASITFTNADFENDASVFSRPMHTIGFSIDANEKILRGFLNGALSKQTSTSNSTYTDYPNNQNCYLKMGGARRVFNAAPMLGYVAVGLIWNRKLSDAEMFSLTTNPWQVFMPEPNIIGLVAGLVAEPSKLYELLLSAQLRTAGFDRSRIAKTPRIGKLTEETKTKKSAAVVAKKGVITDKATRKNSARKFFRATIAERAIRTAQLVYRRALKGQITLVDGLKRNFAIGRKATSSLKATAKKSSAALKGGFVEALSFRKTKAFGLRLASLEQQAQIGRNIEAKRRAPALSNARLVKHAETTKKTAYAIWATFLSFKAWVFQLAATMFVTSTVAKKTDKIEKGLILCRAVYSTVKVKLLTLAAKLSISGSAGKAVNSLRRVSATIAGQSRQLSKRMITLIATVQTMAMTNKLTTSLKASVVGLFAVYNSVRVRLMTLAATLTVYSGRSASAAVTLKGATTIGANGLRRIQKVITALINEVPNVIKHATTGFYAEIAVIGNATSRVFRKLTELTLSASLSTLTTIQQNVSLIRRSIQSLRSGSEKAIRKIFRGNVSAFTFVRKQSRLVLTSTVDLFSSLISKVLGRVYRLTLSAHLSVITVSSKFVDLNRKGYLVTRSTTQKSISALRRAVTQLVALFFAGSKLIVTPGYLVVVHLRKWISVAQAREWVTITPLRKWISKGSKK